VVEVPCGSVKRATRFAKSVSAGIKGSVREGEVWQRALVGSKWEDGEREWEGESTRKKTVGRDRSAGDGGD
jgi:hypothetical protein